MNISRFCGRCKASAETRGFGDVCGKREWPEPVSDLQREYVAGDDRAPDHGACTAPCSDQWGAEHALSAADLVDDGSGDGNGGAAALEPSEAGTHLTGAVYSVGRRDRFDCADRRVGVYDVLLRRQGAA